MAFKQLLAAFRTKAGILVTQPFSDDGQNGDASVDYQGNLWTRDAVIPSGVSAGNGWTYQAVPGDDTAIVRNVPSILTQVGGFNDSAGSIYFQIHDRDIALVLGNAPTMTFLVPANSSFSWNPSRNGRIFSTGIVFGVSSTRDTYTALATSIFTFFEGIVS